MIKNQEISEKMGIKDAPRPEGAYITIDLLYERLLNRSVNSLRRFTSDANPGVYVSVRFA